MPVRRTRRRRAWQFTEEHAGYLRRGSWWFASTGELWPGGAEQIRQAWEEHRESILAEHIKEKPGTRPWAWWRFDSPEPRRQINPGPETSGPANYFGKPRRYSDMPPKDMYETETDYLRRLGLLTKAEQQIDARNEFNS